jgi:beta-galactosidase
MSSNSEPWLSRREFIQASAASIGLPLIAGHAVGGSRPREHGAVQLGRDQPFDLGWKFFKDSGEGFEAPGLDDSAWRTLDLPHDWSIEDLPAEEGTERIGPFDKKSPGGTATGFTVGGEGWYRRHFRMERMPAEGRVEVLFEGVYMESDVWLNGRHLGNRVHGYTPFAFDLTPHLRADGDNVLAVRVRNLGKNSRWYSGSGIYRSVTLDVLPEAAQVARWGVGVVTRRITDSVAEIEIETRLARAAPELVLATRIRNDAGAMVAETSSAAADIVRQSITLASPQLWSPDTPVLYTLETELRRGGRTIDKVSTPFGVRIVSFDAGQGLQINGAAVKLRGGCVHHDNGLLGAAAFGDAEERRILLLKARGFNAIRSSHNPASRAFADACDRHGMLLIEEAFDMWRWPKNPQDYSTHFDENWKADLSAMVLSARNHPSVIMWSIGNEIPNRSTPEGVEIEWNLANEVHRLDPSRPVTAAVNSFAGRPLIADAATARRGFAGIPDESAAMFLDVVGYNYKLDRYEADHVQFPKRVMFGSESFPKQLFDIWSFVDTHPYVIGDFVWSAMDYLGEAGIGNVLRTKHKAEMMFPGWPWTVSNCGDFDLTGRPKPQSYAREVAWGVSPLEMAVQRPLPEDLFEIPGLWGWSDECQSWSWPGAEGKPLAVRIYARADRVELRLNGQVVQSQTLTGADKLPLEFRVPYAPGSLQAIAYRDGREIGRRGFDTVGAPVALRLTFERAAGHALQNSLSYLRVEVIDAEGRVVPDAVKKIQLTVSGPAKLIAFGNGGALAKGSFQSTEAETHDGRALAILKSAGRPGTIDVKAVGEGLRLASATIRLT